MQFKNSTNQKWLSALQILNFAFLAHATLSMSVPKTTIPPTNIDCAKQRVRRLVSLRVSRVRFHIDFWKVCQKPMEILHESLQILDIYSRPCRSTRGYPSSSIMKRLARSLPQGQMMNKVQLWHGNNTEKTLVYRWRSSENGGPQNHPSRLWWGNQWSWDVLGNAGSHGPKEPSSQARKSLWFQYTLSGEAQFWFRNPWVDMSCISTWMI